MGELTRKKNDIENEVEHFSFFQPMIFPSTID
jgi:hypothetical protein